MKRLTYILFALLLEISFIYGQVKNLEMKVDEYLKPYLETGNFSGSLLIARGGKIILAKGYGMANYEHDVPNTLKTKFHLASVSKSFTAAAIMILEEKGMLNVNDPLTKFIPGYPNGEIITIHHLLTHTSGIPNVNVFPDYKQNSRFPQTLDSLVAMFKHKPLNFKPGEKYSYSNSNYNLLAYIIVKISGESYGDFLKKYIFDPLDMKDTGHHGYSGTIIKHSADGYSPIGVADIEKAPYIDWTIKTGNGSLYSTVEDLYKWDRALYTEKILGKQTLAKIFKEHIENVGYGWFIHKHPYGREIYINGRSPGFTSYLGRFIDQDLCIIVLGNIYNSVTTPIGRDLAALVLGYPYEIPKLKNIRFDSKKLDFMVGDYQFGPDFYVPNGRITIVEKDGYLFTNGDWLIPLSETEFIHRRYWSHLTFEKNEKGIVTQLIFDSFKGKKL